MNKLFSEIYLQMIGLVCLVVFLPFKANSSEIIYLSLDSCRQLALENNNALKISKEKVASAQWDKKYAISQYFPKISAMGTYMWNEKDLKLIDFGPIHADLTQLVGTMPDMLKPFVAPMIPGLKNVLGKVEAATVLDIQNMYLGSVSLMQPIFMGGKIVACQQIAQYAEKLALSMSDNEMQDMIYRTDELYWQIVSLEYKKQLSNNYVGMLQKMDTNMQALIGEGISTASDGLAVKVKLNEAEIALLKVENGLNLSKMMLAQMCGLPLEANLQLEDELPAISKNSKESTQSIQKSSKEILVTDQVLQEAFAQRNELKSLLYAEKIFHKKEAVVLADM
ncbi:MAG: TolC family protein, partial [Bacteroidales bacterium]